MRKSCVADGGAGAYGVDKSTSNAVCLLIACTTAIGVLPHSCKPLLKIALYSVEEMACLLIECTTAIGVLFSAENECLK